MNWRHFDHPAPYQQTLAEMRSLAAAIRAGTASQSIWLLEHPPLYTAGTSAQPDDLINPSRFPVYQAGRGGQYSYHGPGQRVVYTMIDLKKWAEPGKSPDIRQFISHMEHWIIETLAVFGVTGERRHGRIGIWVAQENDGGQPYTESKIAALGFRVSRGVTSHGLSINLNPDLSHYDGIVPCGVREYGVTSLYDLGVTISMDDLDAALKHSFRLIFGRSIPDQI